ncbi:Legume-like lectin family protein [Histomonas meleagridis]|uniref:Legume-like lectin family protein n=1 Tax=Histomonas meleagridis TaxID=135588 RepID=UPI00355AC5B7|nr:Legume-like lectin family protein [Histomonas meleagridis]KAH0806433.1 Legume-like lectin family protein [Histomonas meleagridis]
MFVVVLVFQCVSKTTADLSPPFEPTEEGNIGYWEVGGSSVIYKDMIMLTPPIQYRKGFLWTKVEVPEFPWSISFKIEFGEGNGGGGFNFLIVNKYGTSGPICGGPSKFRGISFVGLIDHSTEQQTLQMSLIQSSGEKAYSLENFDHPDISIPFQDNTPILFTLNFNDKEVSVNIDGKQYFTQRLNVSLYEHYIGLTAACNKYYTQINLYEILFKIDDFSSRVLNFEEHQHTLGNHRNHGHVKHPHKSGFRNPIFNKTTSELQSFKRLNPSGVPNVTETPESTTDRVFDVVDEVNHASFDVASFSDLTEFVQENLLMYSQKWQKRTIKIVERVQSARDVAGAAMNSAQKMLDFFNSTLKEKFFKTYDQILNLKAIFEQMDEEGIDHENVISSIAKSADKSPAMKIVVFGSVVEMVLLFGFLVIMNVPSIRKRIIGYAY